MNKEEIKEIKVIKSNHSYMIKYKNGGKFTQYGVEEDLLDYITNLQQENKQLKEINKVLSQELTKDKILKQECLTTCCGIPLGDIPKLKEKIKQLQQENKQLKDNWNKLKEWLNSFYKYSEFEQWEIVKKIQELESENEENE